MTDPASDFATPRMAAGALFADGARVLLVRKTYGDRWDIPGGYVDREESPAQACRREIREELGLDRPPVRLLVCDWAPHPDEGDKLLHIFSCGILGSGAAQIRVDGVELDRWEWVPIGRVDDYLVPRLARRLRHAYRADAEGITLYLEHGEVVLPADRCP
ncbi:NUDIX hydrolase [Nocardia sp. NPDC024068]|uniref:NUDIX hydrolase n=1 Tax=Nocardia sp. NPDC024068 TaxID=3157197 RepID=UPI0033C0F574